MNVDAPTILDELSLRLDQALSRDTKKRKYLQLSETIMSMIDEEVLNPGDRLPTENTLAEMLPVSLGTVQRALRTLSELGVIRRAQRSGTVIMEKTREIHDLWQFRFIDDDGQRVLPVFSKITAMERDSKNGPWRQFLGDDDLLRISRELEVDGRFTAINYFFLSYARYGRKIEKMPSKKLEGVHLHAVIRREFGLPTVRTNNRVICKTIPDPICLQLGLPSAARGLECQIHGYGPNDQPLFFQQIFVPADVQPLEFREFSPTTY